MTTEGAGEKAYDPSTYGETLAPIFDAHLARCDTDDLVAFLRRKVVPPPADVLELGIGTGRVALPLVRAGYAVTGVESSPKMAAQLRAKPHGDRASLIMGDFTTTDLGGPYHVVIAVAGVLWGSVQRSEELLACLGRVARSLRPGGSFVCDAWRPPDDELDLTTLQFERDLPGDGHVSVEFHHDRGAQLVRGSMTVVAADRAAYRVPAVVHYARPAQLDALARQVGLALTHRACDWQGRPHDPTGTYWTSAYRLVD